MSRNWRQYRSSRRSAQRCPLLKVSAPVLCAIGAMQLASWLLAGLAGVAVELTDLIIALTDLIAVL